MAAAARDGAGVADILVARRRRGLTVPGRHLRRRHGVGRQRAAQVHSDRQARGGAALVFAVVRCHQHGDGRVVGDRGVERQDPVFEPAAANRGRMHLQLLAVVRDRLVELRDPLGEVGLHDRWLLRSARAQVGDLALVILEDHLQLGALAAIDEAARARAAVDDVQVEAAEVLAHRHRLDQARPAHLIGRLQVQAGVSQHGPVDARRSPQDLLGLVVRRRVHERDHDRRAARPQRGHLGARRGDRIARLEPPGFPEVGLFGRGDDQAEDPELDAGDLEQAIGVEEAPSLRIEQVG